ncbi:excisionase family protein [Edwardsiella tarda]|uniref:excisionase family protein n=1 Tax=Edwardsiella tarda TaxID=636 RepID=UPI00351C449D
MEITGLRSGTIIRARKESWLVGREYVHISPDGIPKDNSECMYNRHAIDRWVASMASRQPGARSS